MTQTEISETYTVVGVTKIGQGYRLHLGISGSSDPKFQREDALQFIVQWETQNPSSAMDLAGSNDAKAEGGRFTLMSSIGSNGRLRPARTATRNSGFKDDFWMHKNRAETDSVYDLFALKPLYQVDPGFDLQVNDWWVIKFVSPHSFVWSDDGLYNWAPADDTAEEFSVSLPWGASWSFRISSSHVQPDTEADTVLDVVTYTFDGSLYNDTPRPLGMLSPGPIDLPLGHWRRSMPIAVSRLKNYNYYWLPATSTYLWNEKLSYSY